jgi:hypothetical protein
MHIAYWPETQEDQEVDGWIIVKYILERMGWYEPSDFIKCWEVLEKLLKRLRLKKCSAPRSEAAQAGCVYGNHCGSAVTLHPVTNSIAAELDDSTYLKSRPATRLDPQSFSVHSVSSDPITSQLNVTLLRPPRVPN